MCQGLSIYELENRIQSSWSHLETGQRGQRDSARRQSSHDPEEIAEMKKNRPEDLKPGFKNKKNASHHHWPTPSLSS